AIAVGVLGLLAAIAWKFLSHNPPSNPSISPAPVTGPSPTTGTTPPAPVTSPSLSNASPNYGLRQKVVLGNRVWGFG
ncbi:MAG: hypothetical protein ACKO90_37545, partial [Microcystis panniformis]